MDFAQRWDEAALGFAAGAPWRPAVGENRSLESGECALIFSSSLPPRRGCRLREPPGPPK